jgi:hypothetical protein
VKTLKSARTWKQARRTAESIAYQTGESATVFGRTDGQKPEYLIGGPDVRAHDLDSPAIIIGTVRHVDGFPDWGP